MKSISFFRVSKCSNEKKKIHRKIIYHFIHSVLQRSKFTIIMGAIVARNYMTVLGTLLREKELSVISVLLERKVSLEHLRSAVLPPPLV